MKTPAIIGTLAATAAFATTGCAMDFQSDTFETKEGWAVTITAIKHASLRIQYDGLEIQVDPVAKYAPETDYSKFPKADVILVTHEHFDHFDRDTIATLRKDGTEIVANPAVQKMLGFGTALANGESRVLAKGIKLDAVPAYNTTSLFPDADQAGGRPPHWKRDRRAHQELPVRNL